MKKKQNAKKWAYSWPEAKSSMPAAKWIGRAAWRCRAFDKRGSKVEEDKNRRWDGGSDVLASVGHISSLDGGQCSEDEKVLISSPHYNRAGRTAISAAVYTELERLGATARAPELLKGSCPLIQELAVSLLAHGLLKTAKSDDIIPPEIRYRYIVW